MNYYVVKSGSGNTVELRQGKKLYAHTAKLAFKVWDLKSVPEYAEHPRYGRYIVCFLQTPVEKNKSISQTTYRGAKVVAKVSYALFTKRWKEVTGHTFTARQPWGVKVSKKMFDILARGAR